jgi:hypothetical protein
VEKTIGVTMSEDTIEDSAVISLTGTETWSDPEIVFAIITLAGVIQDRRQESTEQTFVRIIEAMDNFYDREKSNNNLQ